MNSSSKTFAPSGRGAVCTIASVVIPIAASFGTAKANLPEPVIPAVNLPTQAEKEDDIVCAFFDGGHGNPSVRGRWGSWGGPGYQPPKTWKSHYIPNYPDSTEDPNIQLYDSLDTEVLRWQDKSMARAGIDIAILTWISQNDYRDDVLAKASRICKNVKWCIYYEREGGSPQKTYDDIKWVLDRNISSNNYAKIDGKWLVFVNLNSQYRSSAQVQYVANKWNEVKEMLANDGYEVYLNADVKDEYLLPEHPWDAVRSIFHRPTVRLDISDTVVDDQRLKIMKQLL